MSKARATEARAAAAREARATEARAGAAREARATEARAGAAREARADERAGRLRASRRGEGSREPEHGR